MTLPVDHIHNLDSYITNEGEAFESVADADLVSMDLWVPSESVAIHLIDPPSAPKRKWAELIPWILEDRLLQPVEDVHFVVCGQSAEGQLQVLVVSQSDVQNWQRVSKNSGVVAQSMYPDYMALPYEDGRVSVGWRDGVYVVRYGVVDGFAASPDMAWSMIDSLLQQDESLKLSLSIPDDAVVPASIVECADINNSELDWQFSQLPSQCNLLQGEYRATFSNTALLAWLPATLLGVISILLSVIYLQIASANMSSEISQLENRLTQSYSRLFDGRRPAVKDVRAEADSRISVLIAQQNSLKSQPIAGLLALDRLMKGCGCQLSGLSFSENALVMQIENGSALKKRKLNIPGYRVGITQQAGEDENAIELRLTPTKTGADQ
ncbi:MAG: type II secretion system protein GspL [Porticoccaceae bacterium]|nr:type II secretion system protein GspL [Porticoccaceae bacterium]